MVFPKVLMYLRGNDPKLNTSNSDLATAKQGLRRDSVPTLNCPSTSNVLDKLHCSPSMQPEEVLKVVVQLVEVAVLVHVAVESNLS